MSKHRAPTSVSLAPTQEPSSFARFVEKYWVVGAGVALVATAVILGSQYMQASSQEAELESWNELLSSLGEGDQMSILASTPDELLAAVEKTQDGVAAPWALYAAAATAIDAREFDKASSALDQLRTRFPDHPLVTNVYTLEAGDSPTTLVDNLTRAIAEQREWVSEHSSLFENPPLPEGSPRVRLVTSDGPIVVGLYEEKAPKHVENFLKLAREGTYDGTKFHRVVKGFMVQGGDPNTVSGEESTWGQGGPGYQVEREENDLVHFRGYLAAAKKGGDVDSSGSQFYITTGDPHHLDGQHVVFGKVLEGMEVVTSIENGAIKPGTQTPENPVVLQSVEIL